MKDQKSFLNANQVELRAEKKSSSGLKARSSKYKSKKSFFARATAELRRAHNRIRERNRNYRAQQALRYKSKRSFFARAAAELRRARNRVSKRIRYYREKSALERILLRTTKKSFVILCNAFPGENQPHGGEFIQTRYGAYVNAGLDGDVIHISPEVKVLEVERHKGSKNRIIRVSLDHIDFVICKIGSGNCKVLCHSPTPILQRKLQRYVVPNSRLNYWFHGFEVRDYRRLYFNFTTVEMSENRRIMNNILASRREASQISFPSPHIRKIFVSEYLRNIAVEDMDAPVSNAHIIPNFINNELFKFKEKSADCMRNYLVLRSFERRNYGNDIAMKAIKLASKEPGFQDLKFTIRGFGKRFKEEVEILEGYSNIDIQEKYSTPLEMASLHRDHGVFLCPSRFDTQGVIMCEAMASGLLIITNAVTGIPEYIDDSCGILVRPDDHPGAYAQAIMSVQKDIHGMKEKSKNAAERVRKQCGFNATIRREIALFSRHPSE